MKAYNEEDYLMLSGIQHFYFCKRQWCLIHIEQQWADNQSTKEGDYLHRKADDPFLKEKRKNCFFSRAVPVSSKLLGLSGILDVVEFRKESSGITLANRTGKWKPYIIEYKRGREKKDLRDVVQLVAEVICLEETLNVKMTKSYFYYAKTKKRIKVEITEELRRLVSKLSNEMHDCYENKITSPAKKFKNCTRCSLYDICIPKLTRNRKTVSRYISMKVNDEL